MNNKLIVEALKQEGKKVAAVAAIAAIAQLTKSAADIIKLIEKEAGIIDYCLGK